MFFQAGNILPYILYVLCIWGVVLLNSCLHIFVNKEKEKAKITDHSIKKNNPGNTGNTCFYDNINQKDKNNVKGEVNQGYNTGIKPPLISIVPFFDSPPGKSGIFSNIGLRAPPAIS